MARIVFHSAAYWGDVMPYVPVANELVRRGHDVTYALPVGHHALLAGERFTVADSGNPFSPDHVAGDSEHEHMVAKRGMTLSGALLGRYYAKAFVVPYLKSGTEALCALGADADLFVTHPTSGVITRIAADLTGVPMLTGHLFPMMLPTGAAPPPGIPSLRLPALNRAVWRATEQTVRLGMFDREINGYRREVGLEPVRAAMLNSGLHDGMLLLCSPTYTPPEPDWPSSWLMTGFTLWHGPTDQALDPAVDAFIDAGDPPVLVTLGTSAASVSQKLFEAIAVRLDDLGLRGLFLTGRPDNVMPAMRDRPGLFSFAPLTEVLPRCRAVVQSGSGGTHAAAMTAGLPLVTVPLLFDQIFHGRRTEQLGIGRMVPRRRRTERLWDAILAITEDDSYARRARAFAAQLAHEDGVTVAADAIERRLSDVS
jgi:rhamnosyltransferase subunit B